MPTALRPADRADAEAIRTIYNAEVAGSTVTFDLVPRSLEDQVAWIEEHSGGHPAIVAVDEREDPSESLIGRGPISWDDLGRGAVLATSSLRRRAQLLHVRSDLEVRDIRGNVDTRLAKLAANAEWSGVLLAAAGLVRLGLADRIGQRLPPEIMLPAPGQGALALRERGAVFPHGARHRPAPGVPA